MTFPIHVKHRKFEAVIYGRTAVYQFYRMDHYVEGKRIVRSFASFAPARKAADATLRELANGSPVSALSAGQAGMPSPAWNGWKASSSPPESASASMLPWPTLLKR